MAERVLLLSLFICLCLADFGIESLKQKVCLYSEKSTKVLTPLQLKNANCRYNTSYCMNSVYSYNNFQYNGPAKLKPLAGEVVLFLSQDEAGRIDFVTMLNAKVDTALNVTTEITGADPAPIILFDDPTGDTWGWDQATNKGKFIWVTKPSYTDGVVIGHINFIDNYCVRSSFASTNNALQTISVLSGNVTDPVRILTTSYTSGSTFEFCQYPRTGSSHTDASCPGRSDGSGKIWIEFGPSNVAYKWFNEAGSIVGNTPEVTGLPAGTYQVFVNDTSSDGCTADRTIVISEPTLYPATVATTPFTCTNKGSASATPVGGTGKGFTFSWFKSDGTQVGTGASPTINNLAVGNYYVKVADSCGSVVSTSFNIPTTGCCGDGICSATEACGSSSFCAADCGLCCPPGTFISTPSKCAACPAGSRSTTYNAISCTSCPGHTFNAGGSEPCTACPENYQSVAGSGKCISCPIGQVRASGETACHSCPAGSFADPCGSAPCSLCPPGTYSAAGAWNCQACAPGSSSSADRTSCPTCTAGSYAAAGAAVCSTCPDGTTSPAGATHLLACN